MEGTEERLTLADLILVRKGTRSYAKLSLDCGGFPGASRIHQIVSGPLNDFPSADTIRGLARGLAVSETEVILAAARSLGLRVATSTPSDLVLNGAGLLPIYAQESLQEHARSLKKALDSDRPRRTQHLAAYDENDDNHKG